MKKLSKKYVCVLVFFLTVTVCLYAEPPKMFYFIGATNTEKVVITVNSEDYIATMEYLTPNRTYVYSLYDCDYDNNPKYGGEIFYCHGTDNVFQQDYEILLSHNEFYTDLRIGKKFFTFKHVFQYYLEK